MHKHLHLSCAISLDLLVTYISYNTLYSSDIYFNISLVL
ncbi:hypothetical protein SAMN04515695_3289 [Pseudovibrio sp. Tun.PSC04-5.I4]|nr:hypothetical protein SAMN04515695_3289 [Pseudovibrio sp. Tun.PSC04-5.I4]